MEDDGSAASEATPEAARAHRGRNLGQLLVQAWFKPRRLFAEGRTVPLWTALTLGVLGELTPLLVGRHAEMVGLGDAPGEALKETLMLTAVALLVAPLDLLFLAGVLHVLL